MREKNPIKVDPVPITLIDKDNSTYSGYFKDYVKNNLGEILTVKKDKDNAELQITIPKGYEEHILDKTQTNIDIKELDDSNYTELVQNFFDNYHKIIYLSSVEGGTNSQNLMILVLMALVFITAGSFKLKEFAKNR